MLNCLLQHTLRSFCTCSSDSFTDNSSKWVYAVFWRILPRNYPPPKWDHGGGILDRAKGNKRNWILVWEDGFCDFYDCEREGSGYIKGRFGADVFFKLSHEVYNYGEGLVGKVAADNSHKWVYRDGPSENDPSFISSWNASIDPQPRAWEVQFSSGIQTIAIISVREGLIQLGSFDKIVEDLNLVISIQRKFSYLQSIPGVYAVQRPYFPIQQHPNYTFKPNIIEQQPAFAAEEEDDKRQLIGSKKLCASINGENRPEEPSIKSINLGYISPQNRSPPFWPIPPLWPSIPCSFGALIATIPPYNHNAIDTYGNNSTQCVRVDTCGDGGAEGISDAEVGDQKVVETSSRVKELSQEKNPPL